MSYQAKFFKETSGKIISIQDNIIIASGLSSSFLGEVVKFKTPGSELIGQILNLEKNLVRIVIIKGSQIEIKSGDSIHRTFKDARTKVFLNIKKNINKTNFNYNNQIAYYHKNFFNLFSNNIEIINNNINLINNYYNNSDFIIKKNIEPYGITYDMVTFEDEEVYYRNVLCSSFSNFDLYNPDNYLLENKLDENEIDYIYYNYSLPLHIELIDKLDLNIDKNRFKFIYLTVETQSVEFIEKYIDISFDREKTHKWESSLISKKENEINKKLIYFSSVFKFFFSVFYRTKNFTKNGAFVLSEWLICIDNNQEDEFVKQLNYFKTQNQLNFEFKIIDDSKYLFSRKYFDNNNNISNNNKKISCIHEMQLFISFNYDASLNSYYCLGYYINRWQISIGTHELLSLLVEYYLNNINISFCKQIDKLAILKKKHNEKEIFFFEDSYFCKNFNSVEIKNFITNLTEYL